MKPWWLLPLGRLHPLWWVVIAAVLLWVDYMTGPKTQFPVVYVLPVIVAAWFSGRLAAVTLALALALVHAVFLMVLWNQSGPMTTFIATTMFRATVVVAMALWLARLSEHERELRRHVQSLEGLLPICAFCKRIRNDAGEWERLESFIAARSDAQFSHSFCPGCWKQHYAELGEAPPIQ